MTHVQIPRGEPPRTPGPPPPPTSEPTQATAPEHPVLPPPAEPPAAAPGSSRRNRLLALAAVAVLVVAAVVAAIVVTTGGGSGGGGDSVTTEGGTTYTVTDVTLADSAAELTDQGLFTLGAGQQLLDPSGTYVVVALEKDGASDTGATWAVVDGEGARHEAGIVSFGLSDLGGDGEAPMQFTELYDVPDEALAGSQLEIVEAGTTYTIDLGL